LERGRKRALKVIDCKARSDQKNEQRSIPTTATSPFLVLFDPICALLVVAPADRTIWLANHLAAGCLSTGRGEPSVRNTAPWIKWVRND